MKYVILNQSDTSSIDFSQVIENNADSLRWKVDNSQTVVKFDSDITPSFLEGKTQYNHAEILAIVSTDEWNPS
ncbi:MAG: hypothetical protein GOVbin4318_45 [Prokaryotic dsDNA virus sp.]|nr:MAG: hypothetical protein GOVbin4318_45 [Prokaryotic dsDNA virus sp.]|tara:strand:+ start:38851 stop:39069 length:219 start_codon:yes stop_codon:yes gene_type:complete